MKLDMDCIPEVPASIYGIGLLGGSSPLLVTCECPTHLEAAWVQPSAHLIEDWQAIQGNYNWAVDHNAQWRVAAAFNQRGKWRNPDYAPLLQCSRSARALRKERPSKISANYLPLAPPPPPAPPTSMLLRNAVMSEARRFFFFFFRRLC